METPHIQSSLKLSERQKYGATVKLLPCNVNNEEKSKT